ARFDQRMNESSVSSKLTLDAGAGAVAGTFEFRDGDDLAVFHPSHPLPFGATCVLTVAAGALDSQGQASASAATATFTTASEPTLSIRTLSPSVGLAGAEVVISGQGFSPVPAQDAVLFNGVLAPITSATSEALSVVVPTLASTGPVKAIVGGVNSNLLTF